MAPLPPLPDDLPPETRAAIERNTSSRAHAEGRAELSEVYAALFHDAGVAARVSELGEEVRFHGTLPDDVRELVILRYAARMGFTYEWSHHQRPAQLAGLDPTVVEVLATGAVPDGLRPDQRAAVEAVDAVTASRPIPAAVQDAIVAAHGTAGAVEVVAVCGLYAVMGYVVTSFELPLEEGFPAAPFTAPVRD